MNEQEERERCLYMMRNPIRWPMWPLLPVKRRKGNGELPDLGLMHTHDNGNPAQPEVVEAPLHALALMSDEARKRAWDEAPKHTYDSLEDLVDDGWVVD